MSKARSFGTVRCTVLWCSVVVGGTAVFADAATLRQSSHRGLRGGASLQEVEVQPQAGCSCPSPAPPQPPERRCPCQDAPTGSSIQEQLQASQMLLAADSAMAHGITAIGLAGAYGGQALGEYNASSIRVEARKSFDTAEQKTIARLDNLLGQEAQREMVMDQALQASAKQNATVHAAHLRETVEDWATNQAFYYMGHSDGENFREMVIDSESIPEIRQNTTEETKGAIQASAEVLKVAQKAQDIASNTPKAQILLAAKTSKKLKIELETLHANIERSDDTTDKVAQESAKIHKLAEVILHQAIQDEANAQQALQQTQANEGKIATLKEQAQQVNAQAQTLN